MKATLALSLTVLATLCAAPLHGAVVTLTSISDAFVAGGSADPNAGNPLANYGGAGAIQISGASAVKGEMQGLLKFDFAASKAAFDTAFGLGNWYIESVTLQLGTNFGTQGAQPNNLIFNPINAGLFQVTWQSNDQWGEGTGNPSSPYFPPNPPVDGITFASLGAVSSAADQSAGTFLYTPVGNTNPPGTPPATYGLTLSSGLQADFLAGDFISFRLSAADPTVSYLFNSRSFGTAANRPTLIVNAVPEPGSAALVLTGIAGLALARRRRHVLPA